MSFGNIEEASETTVSFSKDNSENCIDISSANIYFDTIAPTVKTEITAQNPKDGIYTTGEEFIIKAITSEEIKDISEIPELEVKVGEKAGKFNNGKAQYVEKTINEDRTTTWVYRYVVTTEDNGPISLEYIGEIEITDLAGNTNIISLENIYENIEVDTIVPTVTINAINAENNITKEDEITYTVRWLEPVTGFDIKDVTVINGKSIILGQDDSCGYELKIESSIEPGNVGDVKVIVEAGACTDTAGLSNVRTESVIRVDEKAPVLESIEAIGVSDLTLDKNIDSVKEYYNENDTIKVIVTFDENVVAETIPELALEFSESGNAKGEMTSDIEGNKVIYKYDINENDAGKVAIKGFTGEVKDAVGNKTEVTKQTLNGNKIIVDTVDPKLEALNVYTDEGKYNANSNKIIIKAEFDKEVYAIKEKSIIEISNDLAPELKVKFGDGEEKNTIFKGYDGKDKSTLVYSYTIVDGDNGDNGELKITSYNHKENIEICDIAGNTSDLSVKQTGNTIIADTEEPEVESIEMKVEEPIIKGINGDPSNTEVGYYKAGNEIKIRIKFTENVWHKEIIQNILVGFSKEAGVVPTEYNKYAFADESDWNVDTDTIEYSYRITEGDNGYLWVKVPEDIFRDEAGNSNIASGDTEKSTIFADTTKPTVTMIENTEVIQDNQKITINAKFSENVYDLINNTRVTLTKEKAPKLIYSFGEGENKDISAIKVEGDTIIYEIIKDPVADNGTLNYKMIDGNLCDRAGNLYYEVNTDTTAPILEKIVIGTNAGKYEPYCKEGKEIYVTAYFNEPIKECNMKLKAKIGDKEISELTGALVEDYLYAIRFTYTVQAEENGIFEILDVLGSVDSEDNTYGWVRDEYGNQANIYNLKDVTIIGKAEADTQKSYITNISVIENEKETLIYSKEENITKAVSTNADIVEYVIKYSEQVPDQHFKEIVEEVDGYYENISILNGIIKEIKYTNDTNEEAENYKKEIKITVKTRQEGVQSLIINEKTLEDKAGNTTDYVRINLVTIDFTLSTVRFISESKYVLPTNINKVEIAPVVEVSEGISKIEYSWDNEENYKEVENYSSASRDITIPSKIATKVGTYTLYIRVTDIAGNVTKASKTYQVLTETIDIKLSTEDYTKENVVVTVVFNDGLINRKVTFKPEGSNDVIELNARGTNEFGIEYEVWTNGIVCAEATDKSGNKIFEEETIEKIDKQKPEILLGLDGANLVIGTGKEEATIKTSVKANDENLKEIKYLYSTNENLTEEEKAAMKKVDNYGEAKITNAKEGTYYLHVVALDEAGNETSIKSSEFIVENSNIKKDEEGNITFTPADKNTIKFERQQQTVYVKFGDNLTKEQDITFTNVEDGDKLNGYVEILKPTTITATAEDACGNKVIATYVVESVDGPYFEVIGNPESWTNGDVKLTVSTYEQLKALTVNRKDILSKNPEEESHIIVTQNGDYEFVATDIYGNVSKQTIKVDKIDKEIPVISKVEVNNKDIIITATDELSGVSEYAVTSTTELPLEWSGENTIKTAKDGVFFIWVKDIAGNITRTENTIEVDTTAPVVTLGYTSLTVTVGIPLEANIVTSEKAMIFYSWDGENWTNTEELVNNMKVSKETTLTGTYTLYVKAKDEKGNESAVQTLEFNVVNVEDLRQPEILFENLATIQVNGVRYVKVPHGFTAENLTSHMDKKALDGILPEYAKLTEDGKLKTGTEITLNGEARYVVVVNGDVDGDGQVTFLGDIIKINNHRIGIAQLSTIEMLAGDINSDGKIDFINDIIAINNYRIGIISSL